MGAFVGEKNLDVIKMHGTTIKKFTFMCSFIQICGSMVKEDITVLRSATP
jgi:hypothetical protein